MEVPVELSPTVRLGTPRMLFALDELGMQNIGRYFFYPTPDPDRFLLLKHVDRGARSRTDAILVENWVAEFAKRR